jgi:hypothetical protein
MTIDEEKVLLGLVDTLLPGGAGFPAASTTGMIQQVATRLCLVDVNLLKRLAAVFAARGGLPHNDAPLPAGYPNEPFEHARDAPRHARGRWIPTDAVQRVDLNPLSLAETR